VTTENAKTQSWVMKTVWQKIPVYFVSNFVAMAMGDGRSRIFSGISQ